MASQYDRKQEIRSFTDPNRGFIMGYPRLLAFGRLARYNNKAAQE